MEPLWDRVDRNRARLFGYVAVFVLASVAGLDLLFALPLLFVVFRTLGEGTIAAAWGAYWTAMAGLSVVLTVVAASWSAATLMRSEKWLLKRFGARLVPKGELLDTKFALKDMAIAAGLDVAPALYLIPETTTNAFVFAARRRRAVIGITEGFTRKLSVDEQRAVFANLVARLVSGDTIVSTGVAALMWPLQTWRDSRMTAGDDTFGAMSATIVGSPPRQVAVQAGDGPAGIGMTFVIFGFGFALLAELVAAGNRRAQLTTAEKADAEGMLYLKDPTAMLSALKHCIELDNVVPVAGEGFAELFYCWTGISTDDENDPEWERVARLREVLGVMGYDPAADMAQSTAATGVPPAPRLEGIGQGVQAKDMWQ